MPYSCNGCGKVFEPTGSTVGLYCQTCRPEERPKSDTMPDPADHPTSLPKGPLRDCLERIQTEICREMNAAQSQPEAIPGCAAIDKATLGHWINRLTEAIHFNGRVPEVISGIASAPPSWPKLDDAMRHLTYISGQPMHATMAFTLLTEFRHGLYKQLVTASELLERFADKMIITFDLDEAQKAVKGAYQIITHDILGLR